MKRRKEAVSLALNGRKISLGVLVTATRLKQFLDRRGVGKHRLINLDARQIPLEAIVLDPRALRSLARDAQFVERGLQGLQRSRREGRQIAERRQFRFGLTGSSSGAALHV